MGEGKNDVQALLEENARLRHENGALQHEKAALQHERDDLYERIAEIVRSNQSLAEEIELLRRRYFGRRSEKFHPSQLCLFPEEESQGQDAPTPPEPDPEPDDGSSGAVKAPRRRRQPRQEPRLPDDLPVDTVPQEVPAEQRVCGHCGEEMTRIGTETSVVLEYVPASFRRIHYVREKVACKSCELSVERAPAPERPLPKALPGPGLLACILISKYKDHLPLHRQTRIFARSRVKLPRATLCDWVMGAAECLRPLVELMSQEIVASDYLQTDDTRVLVQVPKGDKRKVEQGYLWPYRAGDQVVYDFTLSRESQGPARFLEHFQGYLQTDDYAGYHGLQQKPGITGVGCWAHARRYFVDAFPTDVQRIGPILALLRFLYEIEREAKQSVRELPEEERAAALARERAHLRQTRSRPVIAELLRRVHAVLLDKGVTPASLLGRAARYTRRNRRNLLQFLRNGALEIDNNLVEQCVRPIALGRKNWLFAGSPRGGTAAATIYSLVETCRLQKVDVFEYLRDVLQRLPSATPDQLPELTPRGWRRARQSPAAPASC